MNEFQESLNIKAIGLVHTPERYRYEAPRQGVFANNEGYIELVPGNNFETALCELEGFERIWVIFKFHLNSGWNPKVSPPVISPPGRRVGVFASRSPHRPNPLGISAVELVGVERLRIYIRNFDMLDGTPVFDIKPYIPRADAFPEARCGWVEQAVGSEYELCFSAQFSAQNDMILAVAGLDLANFCSVQLANNPLNAERKRLTELADGVFEIACRTWRIRFWVDSTDKTVHIMSVRSGYAPEDLAPAAPDPYGDKQLHREFIGLFC